MPKGTYLLILSLAHPGARLAIGRLGCYDFAAGYYLYVGSASGSGGIPARLAYHQQRHKRRPHWHIDYLRAATDIYEIWTIICTRSLEHEWCRALQHMKDLVVPIRGFGASDSPLQSHLFYTAHYPHASFLSHVLLAPEIICHPDLAQISVEIHRLLPQE